VAEARHRRRVGVTPTNLVAIQWALVVATHRLPAESTLLTLQLLLVK
jgi:hypothetical protein